MASGRGMPGIGVCVCVCVCEVGQMAKDIGMTIRAVWMPALANLSEI